MLQDGSGHQQQVSCAIDTRDHDVTLSIYALESILNIEFLHGKFLREKMQTWLNDHFYTVKPQIIKRQPAIVDMIFSR
jgi:hypothetical protein